MSVKLFLGAPATESYTTDPLSQADCTAWLNGSVVATAAGNSGPAAGSIKMPGTNPDIITVGRDG